MLGRDAAGCLGPYLTYTRATHLDLERLSQGQGPPGLLASWPEAVRELG
jgi:hypothetical protein